MTHDLLLPIHVHSLVVEHPTDVAGPPLDYARLPWFDGTRDHNGSVPYLASAIADAPFSSHPHWLKPGVHLHWTLPDGLRRGSNRADALRHVRVGELWLPPAPNRWLVLRSPTAANGVTDKAWLVESDYVHPDTMRPREPAIAYPRVAQWKRPPWLYLGRKIPLDPANLQPLARTAPMDEAAALAQIGGPLTALGPGDPCFAAHYPSCHSVFGLHDDEPAEAEVRYIVYGWYSAAVGDPLKAALTGLMADQAQMIEFLREAGGVTDDAAEAALTGRALDGAETDMAVREYLRTAMNLTYFGTAGHLIDGLILQGQTDLEATPALPPAAHLEPAADARPADRDLRAVGIGSSAAEALVALKTGGATLDQGTEDRLVQALAATDLTAHALDLGAKLHEARHNEQFRAERGHAIWVLRRDEDHESTEDPVPLPDEAAHALAELNRLQRDYDTAMTRIDGLRQELFNDWSHYLRAAYPEADDEDFAVDLGRLQDLIGLTRLIPLEAALAQAGQLFFAESPGGNTVVSDRPFAAPVEEEDALSLTLAARIVRQQGQVLASLQTGLSGYHVGLAPGPRYWRPNDPVIVLDDHRLRTRDQYASTGANSAAGDHTTRRHATAYVYVRDDGWENAGPEFAGTARAPVGLLTSFMHDQLAVNDFGWRSRYSPDDWDPLTLEWEVEIRPLSRGGNLSGTGYSADFLTSAHVLPQATPELSRRAASPQVAETYAYLAGRTILNPTAGKLLARRLDALPAALREPMEALAGTPMVLPLGGFHDLLLMRQQAPQLPVDDPIGLPRQRDLAQRVRLALGDMHPATPRPDFTFHPIRSGEVHLQRLRVRDVFGRAHDWVPDVLRTTRRMNPTGAGANKAVLPPRLAQSARISFRWLRAGSDDQESTTHAASSPVIGWLLPNDLDGAVEIYGGTGHLLGAVGTEGIWQPAPGDADAPRSWREIDDPALARVVRWLVESGTGFVDRFIESLERSLEVIEPAGSARLRPASALIGRPLALVRAQLGLELAHHMAIDQSLASLRTRLAGQDADTHGVEQVGVPLRLGEHGQLDDGLCGFWIEEGGEFRGARYNAVHVEAVDAAGGRIAAADGDDGQHPVQVTPDGPPLTVTMLMEPHGTVHATTGILPTKSVSLPPEHYHDALDRLRVPFATGPVLTPRDAVEIPLPDLPGYSLSWIAREGDGWHEVPHHPTVTRAEFRAGFGTVADDLWALLAEEGRLVEDGASGRAVLMPAPAEAEPDRFAPLGLTAAQVDRGLHELALAIAPAERRALYRPRPIARDGWLQLRPVPQHVRPIDPAPPATTTIDWGETS